MATYEVRFTFADQPFDEHRRFLGSVLGSSPSGLDGVRRLGSGVELLFIIETDRGPELAERLATQRVTGIWPNTRPTRQFLAAINETTERTSWSGGTVVR